MTKPADATLAQLKGFYDATCGRWSLRVPLARTAPFRRRGSLRRWPRWPCWPLRRVSISPRWAMTIWVALFNYGSQRDSGTRRRQRRGSAVGAVSVLHAVPPPWSAPAGDRFVITANDQTVFSEKPHHAACLRGGTTGRCSVCATIRNVLTRTRGANDAVRAST